MNSETRTDDQPSEPSGRAFRAKPGLGKGKACESCRSRRIRCNGARPSCSNCIQADRDCVYLDKPRPPASAAALSAKLAGLEERYRILSEASRNDNGIAAAESAMNWVASLDYPTLPPVRPESAKPQPGALDDPYLEGTMAKRERKLMIELYQSQCYRYGVIITPSNLFSQLEDPDAALRPHACVFNAMMLVARDIATTFVIEPVLDEAGARYEEFVLPDSTPSEDTLTARIQAQCTQSLADVDRLTDYIQAALLLAYWYVRKGRVLEGQYSAAAVNRLVINCKMHQIDDEVMRELAPGATPRPDGQSRWDGSLLGRPKDREDLAIRISLFWESFWIDKVLRILTGVPPTYDDDDICHITTVFPRSREEYISGSAFGVPYTSIDNLFDGTTFPAQPLDTLDTMIMKAMALLDRSIRYIHRQSASIPDVLQLYSNINYMKVSAQRTFSSSLYTRPAPVRSRAFCVATFRSMVQLLVLIAEIHVTHIKNPDGTSVIFDREKDFTTRIDASHACSAVLGVALEEIKALGAGLPLEGRRPGIEHTCFVVGLLLMFPTSILMEKIHKLEISLEGEPEGSSLAQLLEQERSEEESHLEAMLETVHALRETYPVVEVQWQAMQQTHPTASVS